MNQSMNTKFVFADRPSQVSRQQSRWTRLLKASTLKLRRWLSVHPMDARDVVRRDAYRQTVDRDQTFALARTRGHSIACESGILWLTFDGDPRDIVLEPGQSQVCDSDGRLLVHALTAGAFRFV